MYFASAEPALREANWLATISFIVVFCLFLMALYLVLRTALTNPAKLPYAPKHIQSANAILKWIATASPLIAVWGVCFDIYDIMIEAGYKGVTVVTPFMIGSILLVYVILGLSVSLFALAGIAALFIKKTRYERSVENSA